MRVKPLISRANLCNEEYAQQQYIIPVIFQNTAVLVIPAQFCLNEMVLPEHQAVFLQVRVLKIAVIWWKKGAIKAPLSETR